MPKFIQDEAREQYKKRLIEFSQQINPKQHREIIEKRKEEIRKARK
jgi:UDP-N-acetyl-D-mannosaminuronate dehydrogenase